MRTCIVYMTKHGCTEKTANMLHEQLDGDVSLVDLGAGGAVDLSAYDAIIIGGSIHAGKVQKGIQRFCRKHRELLLNVRLGLYLCHMEEGETALRQLEGAYPEELRSHASAMGLFGGEFDLKKMNFIERKIVKNIAKIEDSVTRIDGEAVREFALKMGAHGAP